MKALVTGANGDIGCAITCFLLANGFAVTVADKNHDKLDKLALSCNALEVLHADFTYQPDVQTLLNELKDSFDVLVYAAGVREICPITCLSLSEWQNVFTVNLTTAYLFSQRVIELAIESKKPLCIIYISSISGLQGEAERSAYCASKHGLIGLAKSLAIELAVYSVRVNVIAPGIIDTELTRPYKSNLHVMEQLKQNIPLTCWGMPEHVVQAVEFIIKNDYVTGSTLVVDGGWMAGKNI